VLRLRGIRRQQRLGAPCQRCHQAFSALPPKKLSWSKRPGQTRSTLSINSSRNRINTHNNTDSKGETLSRRSHLHLQRLPLKSEW
jgi:hypothetical protein